MSATGDGDDQALGRGRRVRTVSRRLALEPLPRTIEPPLEQHTTSGAASQPCRRKMGRGASKLPLAPIDDQPKLAMLLLVNDIEWSVIPPSHSGVSRMISLIAKQTYTGFIEEHDHPQCGKLITGWDEFTTAMKVMVRTKFLRYYDVHPDVNGEQFIKVFDKKALKLFRDALSYARTRAKKRAVKDAASEAGDGPLTVDPTDPDLWRPFTPDWMSQDAWNGLCDYWSTPEWHALCSRNSINRKDVPGGLHTAKSMALQRKLDLTGIDRMGAVSPSDIQGDPLPGEREGARVDRRDEEVYETYTSSQAVRESKSGSNDTPSPDAQKTDWITASGGWSHGKSYGLGPTIDHSLVVSVVRRSTTTLLPGQTMYTPFGADPQQIEQMEQRIMESLEERIEQEVERRVEERIEQEIERRVEERMRGRPAEKEQRVEERMRVRLTDDITRRVIDQLARDGRLAPPPG